MRKPLYVLAALSILGCKARNGSSDVLAAPPSTPAAVRDTPTLITFINQMDPKPHSAGDVYRALRAANATFTRQVATLNDSSAQPGERSSDSPRAFVFINDAVICSTGPEGRIEVATFPSGTGGELQGNQDASQMADISFKTDGPEFKVDANVAECAMCHGHGDADTNGNYATVDPIEIGKRGTGASARDADERPFPLTDWWTRQCGDQRQNSAQHQMCANVQPMLNP